MQETLNAIRSMCLKFPTQEKILIIPAFRMKGQILKYINDSGMNVVNLRVMSAGSIAMEWAEADILNIGAKVLTYNDVSDLVGEIASKLKEEKKLAFFANSIITPGLSRTISNGIIELKKNGIKEGKINLDKLENKKKRSDLNLILSQYGKLLKERNYLDQADVIKIALENIKSGKTICSACYIVPGTRLSYLEKEMLEHLWPNNEKMPVDKSETIKLKAKGKDIHFTKAYGEYNEAKEVIRNIVNNKLPLDSVLVAVTTGEPYAQLFYQLFQEYITSSTNSNIRTEIPITFGTGLPVTFSNPGKLALAILKWIKFGYRAHDLISIFASGALNLNVKAESEEVDIEEDEKQTATRQTIISLIKNSNLKWQRQTYHKTFEEHNKYLKRKITEAEADKLDCERQTHKLETLIWLDDYIENNFLSNIPMVDSSGNIDADQLYRGVGKIIEKCKRINDKTDTGGYTSILNEMKGSLKSENVPVAEAVDILVDRIKQIRTFVENPAPGKLHLCNYKTAPFVNRGNVFVLGLHAASFPGLAVEDPILLDEERLAISKEWLATSKQLIEDNISQMNAFIDSVDGKLIFSYPYFDTVDNRRQYPCIMYSEMMDMAKVEAASKGEDGSVENTVEFLVPNYKLAIDENDYWLRMAINSGVQGESKVLEELKGIHPGLFDIHENASKRREVTGMVEVSKPELIDPRKNNKIQSASVLSDYLICKYKYFLKHIIHLKEYKEREFDTIGWLDALESGSLFHEILEEFHNQGIKDSGILKDEEKAKFIIGKIAKATIVRYEENLPTASAYYTDKKKEDILLDCAVFAAEEVLNHKNYKPFLTEYRFGFDGKLELSLGDGEKIRIMGAIDRIDKLGNDALRIVDYKTGGDGSYSILDDENAEPLNHKTMQPALYYMAMKKLAVVDPSLSSLDKIKEATYYFVNRKGDYKERNIVFDRESETIYKGALIEIFHQMSAGIFNQSEIEQKPNKKKHGKEAFKESYICRYCGYKEICEQSFEYQNLETNVPEVAEDIDE